MKKSYYEEALRGMLYSQKGINIIKKSSLKDFEALKKIVIDEGDEDKFEEGLNNVGFGGFAVSQIIKDIEESKIKHEVVAPLSLVDLIEGEGLLITLDEMAEKTSYIVKEMKKTGRNRSYRMMRKNSLTDLKTYISSRAGVKPEVMDEEEIKTMTPLFDPTQGSMFDEDDVSYFNTWAEPMLLCMTKDTPEPPKPKNWRLLELALMNLFESEAGVDYALDVIAWGYQNKQSIPNILIMMGVQGSSKGLFELLLTSIWTEGHMSVGDKKANIFMGNDNGPLKDKLIYLLDETPIGGVYYDIAKRYAGNGTFVLKELYQTTRQYPNRAIFINTFNLVNPGDILFDLSEDDRRISLFESTKQIIEYPEFRVFDYVGLGKVFKEELPEYFAWLLATREVDFQRIKRPFMNRTRERWVAASKDHTEDFYRALVNKDIDYFVKVADGVRFDGWSIVDTLSRVFSDDGFAARVTDLSVMFHDIFGRAENKEIRDGIVGKLRSRDSSSSGGKGSFVYNLDKDKDKDVNVTNIDIGFEMPRAPGDII